MDFALRAHPLTRPLQHLREEVAEVIGRTGDRVEPLGREELAPGALVLSTCFEPGEEPPVDVVAVHRLGYRQPSADG